MAEMPGILNSKQRKDIASFLGDYEKLVSNDALSDALRDMIKSTIGIWVAMARFALYVDCCKRLDYCLYAGGKG